MFFHFFPSFLKNYSKIITKKQGENMENGVMLWSAFGLLIWWGVEAFYFLGKAINE
jgi:hypothetical protein